MMKLNKIPLHIQILLAIFLAIIVALTAIFLGLDSKLSSQWIKPFGDIFVRLLKMVATPLVLASLVIGVANLGDVKKLSKLGGKTIALFLSTTFLASVVGLVLVNLIQPGKVMDKNTRDSIILAAQTTNNQKIKDNQASASAVGSSSPLKALVDMVPENIFKAFTDNGGMLQVVFFAIFIGIATLSVGGEKAASFLQFMNSLNELIMKMIELIMKFAPFGVFCLMTNLLIEIAGTNPKSALEILKTLGVYSFTVILGLAIMLFFVYPSLIKLFSNMKIITFFKGIAPAQLLGFSTSSSSATLPVTMDCVEKKLGLNEEVSSFVIPLGATINMDGTCLYQSVAAVFIMQCFGVDLSFSAQVAIVLTATLASIGSAGVPGAGMVMLIVVLQAIQPSEISSEVYAGIISSGMALILAPDRLLDMCRTMVNITGDCAVSVAIAGRENHQRSHNKLDE